MPNRDPNPVRLPAGLIFGFAGAEADIPAFTLLCDNTAVSRTEYANLFARIGTAWGVGDGSTTFNLPDYRGRVIVGADNMGGSSANVITDAAADSIGGEGGVETHALSQAELPSADLNIRTGATGSGLVSVLDNGSGDLVAADATTGTSIAAVQLGGSGTAHTNKQPYATANVVITF